MRATKIELDQLKNPDYNKDPFYFILKNSMTMINFFKPLYETNWNNQLKNLDRFKILVQIISLVLLVAIGIYLLVKLIFSYKFLNEIYRVMTTFSSDKLDQFKSRELASESHSNIRRISTRMKKSKNAILGSEDSRKEEKNSKSKNLKIIPFPKILVGILLITMFSNIIMSYTMVLNSLGFFDSRTTDMINFRSNFQKTDLNLYLLSITIFSIFIFY